MRNEKYLYITTKDGSIIGKLRERDGISECRLTEKQNDNSMVVVLSSGIAPLTVNGIQLSCPYSKGTAAY